MLDPGTFDSKHKSLPFWFFHGKQWYCSKKWRWLIQWKKARSSRSVSGKNFPNFKMLDAKIASALNKIVQYSHFTKKVSLEEQKVYKEDRFLRGRQIAFVICDFFRVTGAHDTVLDYADLISVTLRDDNIQEFDTGWDGSFIIYVKDSIRWWHRKSVQNENTWVCATQNRIRIVRHGDSSENIDSQVSKFWDNGEEEYISQTSIRKLCRQARETWNRSSDRESKGDKWRWRRKRYLFPVERKSPMFERRPVQFRAWEQRSCAKTQNTEPSHLLSQQWHEVEVCRWKEVSRAKVILISFFDHRVDTIWKVLARDRLVSIGILPNVNSIKLNRAVKQVISVLRQHHKVEAPPSKKPKKKLQPFKAEKSDGKGAVAVVRTVPQFGLCLARLGAIRTCEKREVSGKPEAESVGIKSTSTIHTVYATSSKYPRQRTIAWKNTSQKSAKSPTL